MEPLLTTEEVADFLRVDVVTVRRLINKGGLPAYRVGSEFRFARADLEEFLRRQRTSGGEAKMATDRFEKFTERSKKILQLASEEARRFNHNYIGTEHLLLGLVGEGGGIAIQVLHSLGAEPKIIRQRLEFIIKRGEHVSMDMLGLTPRAKKAIEFASDEAVRLQHHFVGTEHMLLGLIREGDGIAAGVLESLGVNLQKAREKTLELLGTKTGAPPTAEMMAPPPVPAEAATLVPIGTVAIACATCDAPNLPYFHYCFNCGAHLPVQGM